MPGVKEPAGPDVRMEDKGSIEGSTLDGLSLPSLNGSMKHVEPQPDSGALFRRYTLAIGATFIALLLRFAVEGIVGEKVVYATFFLSVAITSGYGGLGPALLATVLGFLAAAHFFVPPTGSLLITERADQVSLALYGIVCLTFATVGELRQRALRRVQESEARFRSMADAAPVLVWVSGEDKGGVFFNKRWLDFTGRSLEEELGEKWLESIHSDDMPALSACVEAFEQHKPFRTQFRLRRHDGVYRWMLDTGVPRFASEGTFLGFIGTCVDITDQIEVEEDLRKRVEEITRLHEAGRLLGSTLDPERVYDTLHDLVARAMSCDSLVVSSYDSKDGMIRCSYAWVEGNKLDPDSLPAVPLAPEGQGMQSNVIRSGEPLLVSDVEAAKKRMTSVYHVDRNSKVQKDPHENDPPTKSILLVPMKLENQVLGVVQVMSQQEGAYTPDDLRTLEALVLQMAAAARNAYLYRQAQREIEERKRVAEALRLSEERFRIALSSGAVVAYQQDVDLRYLWLHPIDNFRHSIGKTDSELLSDPEEAKILEEMKRRVMQTREGERREIKTTFGENVFYYDVIAEPMYGLDGELIGVGGAALDVTERKQFENALLESREAERRFQEQLTALHLVEDELSMAPTLDKIYRLAVTLAHSRLGFDRIAIWMRDDEVEDQVRGTYGIDESGMVRDEREAIVTVSPTSVMGQVLSGEMQIICSEDAVLYNHHNEIVGRGTHCIAALWDGTNVIGCVTTDNLISQEPITEQRRELLNLFATNLGHLCSRKRVEEALRASQDRYRTFVEQSSEAMWRIELEEPVEASLPIEDQIKKFFTFGYLAECNDAMAQMYGCTKAEELIGTRLAQMVIPEDPNNIEYLATFIKNGYRIHDAESVEKDSQGNVKYFLNNLIGIVEDGKVVRGWGTQRDVTERKKIEEDLRQSEERLRLALEAGRMGIWDWNVQTNELQWSPQLEPIHGFDPGTFDGKMETFLDRVLPDDLPSVREQIQKALQTGDDFYTDFRVRYPDGSLHWVAGTGKAFFDGAGNPVRMIGVGLDITPQREAQEELRLSEERFRRMVDQSPLSVQILSPDGRTLRVNKAWEELWGATLEMLEGYNMLEDEQLEKRGIMPYIKQAFAGEPAQIPATPYSPEMGKYAGQERWSRAFIYPVRSQNKIREVVLIHEDITEQRRAEEEIRQLNAELEQRVEQRTAQLQAANRELEGFSYSVSHDLRTPLRSISGFSKVLLDDYGDRLDDEAKDYLHRIMNAGFRMTDMIDDLLQYSRLGRREMRIEQVNLSQIAHEVSAEIVRRHPDSRAKFDLQPDLAATCDPQLLRVVLENLLENAHKFTGKTEEPMISFGAEQQGDERVFFVRDNGIGFDPQYMAKLFQPFERLHRTVDYPGTGIGLANVQRIISRHNGRVWAEGEVGKGATFYFTLG